MISSEAIAWSSLLLTNILSIAGRALVLAAVAGVTLAVLRVKSTSLRLFTWTSVLYAVGALSIAGWMLPSISVPLPAIVQKASTKRSRPTLPAAKEATAARVSSANYSPELRPKIADDAITGGVPASTNVSASSTTSIPWNSIAACVYLIVAAFFLARILVGWLFARRLLRWSEPIPEDQVTKLLSCRAANWQLRTLPRVAESELISVPVTLGAGRATVLLPASWRQWEETKLDAVLSHELSHVARRDPLTQLVSLIHRAMFWFSPLAWWLDRHLKDLAEQASDEAALLCGANRSDYARALLGFFATLQAAPQRVWWQGVSMATAGQAEQRVERILGWRGAVTMKLKRSVVLVTIALGIPVVYLAASVRPMPAHGTIAAVRAQEPTPPPEARAMATPPSAASAPAAPSEPATPAISQDGGSHERGYSYAYGYDDEQRFVIVPSKSDEFTISGSSEDARHVAKLRRQIPGAFIWFQRDEKSYVIRDQATVEHALRLWAPQRELGAKQEELGKQQEDLGKQQSELGAQMQRVRVKVPDMTADLDKLRAELKSLSSGATADQVGRIQSEIGELQSRIGEVQSSAGEQQSKIGERMSALGEKQSKLGEQQSELGRQQADLARKATNEMRAILDEALKKGIAQPEPDTTDSGTI